MGHEKNEKASRYPIMRVLEKTDKLLKKGEEVFKTFASFQEKPTTAGALSVGAQLTRTVLGSNVFSKYRPKNWDTYSPGSLHQDSILKILEHFKTHVAGDNVQELVTFYDLQGTTLAYDHAAKWIKYLKEEIPAEELSKKVSNTIWDICGSPCMVRTYRDPSMMSAYSSPTVQVEYAPADIVDPKNSKICSKIIERTGKFLDHGYKRSILLNGPPGTGKSTIISSIADYFCSKALIIDSSDVSLISSSTLTNIVTWLAPDCLVINDIDRAFGVDRMLGALETLNHSIKLIMVSSNDKEKLPAALKRPGRFDDIFEITTLDEKVVESMLGIPRSRVPIAVWEDIKSWPAAFLVELGKIVQCLGEDSLVEEYCNLNERVKKNLEKEEEKEEK